MDLEIIYYSGKSPVREQNSDISFPKSKLCFTTDVIDFMCFFISKINESYYSGNLLFRQSPPSI